MRSFFLKLGSERIDINTRLGELSQYLLAVTAIRRHHSSHFAMIGKRLQRALGLKVTIEDRNGRGKVIIEYARLEDFDALMERFAAE